MAEKFPADELTELATHFERLANVYPATREQPAAALRQEYLKRARICRRAVAAWQAEHNGAHRLPE